jgi:hypothetical protein
VSEYGNRYISNRVLLFFKLNFHLVVRVFEFALLLRWFWALMLLCAIFSTVTLLINPTNNVEV